MRGREVYFLFTDTGSYLTKLINFFTRQELNHVSISFNKNLHTVYSFGRKQPNNPFIGGFVLEDINDEFLSKADCAIYRKNISEIDYQRMMAKIKEIESIQDEYRYNFIGLFGVLFQVKVERKRALFCSQFVATVLKESDCYSIDKPVYFITPTDIRRQADLQLVYQGKLNEYHPTRRKLILEENIIQKQSFIYNLSHKFKQFVIK